MLALHSGLYGLSCCTSPGTRYLKMILYIPRIRFAMTTIEYYKELIFILMGFLKVIDL